MNFAVANGASEATFSPPIGVPPLAERARRALSALAVLAKDHTRLDQVLVFTQAMNHARLARIAQEIESTPGGAELFATRPRIDRTTWRARATERTLGPRRAPSAPASSAPW